MMARALTLWAARPGESPFSCLALPPAQRLPSLAPPLSAAHPPPAQPAPTPASSRLAHFTTSTKTTSKITTTSKIKTTSKITTTSTITTTFTPLNSTTIPTTHPTFHSHLHTVPTTFLATSPTLKPPTMEFKTDPKTNEFKTRTTLMAALTSPRLFTMQPCTTALIMHALPSLTAPMLIALTATRPSLACPTIYVPMFTALTAMRPLITVTMMSSPLSPIVITA